MASKAKIISPTKAAAMAAEKEQAAATVVEEQEVVATVVEEEIPTVPTTEEVKEEPTKVDDTPAVEEVKEEASVVEPTPIEDIKTPEIPVKEEPNVPLEVKFIKDYISHYKSLTTAPLPDTKKCNEAFEKIMRYAIQKQNSVAVLDELYGFFHEYKNSFLVPSKALIGVASYKAGIREKIQITYTLMYELVSGSKGPFDLNYAAEVLGGTGFVSYISSRLKK